MSRPRLHDKLQELFESKDHNSLNELLLHSDYQDFLGQHGLGRLTVKDLSISFTHTSFSHEFGVGHQEIMEFLGDSVLQLIVTEELVRRYPNEAEGKLSKLRSGMVNEKSLATIANGLGISKLILVGKGEFKKSLHLQEAVLADSLEALICQIYRIEGFEKVRSLILQWFAKYKEEAFSLENLEVLDYKSKLQEATLARYKSLPKYVSEERSGGFQVQLWINQVMVGQGTYHSKRVGEKELAEKTLKSNLF